MGDLKIEYMDAAELHPYENNPRHNDEAVEYVANSIREFGFKVPIIIDKDNVIVAGHTRLKAAERLGLTKVPCIRADDLSEDQVKAFRLADNKVSEFASWDLEKLEIELEDIEIDMSAFGMKIDDIKDIDADDEEDGWYGDERERTNNAYNLGLIDPDNLTKDFWQMPIIHNDGYIPTDMIGFNYAKTSREKSTCIHFYVDDYQFERIWNYPEKYLDTLLEYDAILTPDFSLYMDMPMAMKIWNVYRSRLIGAYFQSQGLKVIPTISWAEKETFKFCFKGIPKGSIVSISTVGIKEDEYSRKIWREGMQEMIKQIEPQAILVYGGYQPFDYGNIETHYYENKVTENWGD